MAGAIESVQLQIGTRWVQALAHLYAGDLPASRTAIESAHQYDYPPENSIVLAILGIVNLRQNNHVAAQKAFTEAIAKADELLMHTDQNFKAQDIKGIALCGLALCGTREHLPTAQETFHKARQMTKDAGIVRALLRLFDALAENDSENILQNVRKAAAG